MTFYMDGDTLKVKGKFPSTRLRALRASIRKWEFITALLEKAPRRQIADRGTDTCALCQLYYNHDRFVDHCDGCPVMEKTGQRYCDGTPYGSEKGLKRAQGEVEFLRSLLPQRKAKA